MSSSDTKGAVAGVVATAGKGGTVAGLFRAAQIVAGLLRTGSSPLTMGLKGFLTVGRLLAFTTLGRVTVLVVMLVGTFSYFKNHFTALEAHKWQVEVKAKQEEIVGRVVAVNAETRRSQEAARAEVGFWTKITAVVVDGIWKTQPPHPIEKETIDLINETRHQNGAGK